MLNCPCRVLLVEDESEDIEIVQKMLRDVRSSFFTRGFELVCAETLSEAKQIISEQEQFNVILLDLMLPDSRNMNSLQELQAQAFAVPIIVQTALEDEVVAVKALESGASGYLPKVASDRNLLLYAIRSAIERQQQLAKIEQSQQQQQEFDMLENMLIDVSDLKNNTSFKQRIPDVFAELKARYHQLLDRFVEQKIYRVEYELSSEMVIFVEQLGYLQASPRDLIELHTTVLKQIQKSSAKNSKAYLAEGRYLLLELMGKLVIYYRRYYIGLNKINLSQDYQNISIKD